MSYSMTYSISWPAHGAIYQRTRKVGEDIVQRFLWMTAALITLFLPAAITFFILLHYTVTTNVTAKLCNQTHNITTKLCNQIQLQYAIYKRNTISREKLFLCKKQIETSCLIDNKDWYQPLKHAELSSCLALSVIIIFMLLILQGEKLLLFALSPSVAFGYMI